MCSLFAFFGLGPTELALVAVLGLLLFGRKLPSMGNYLGQSIRSFQRGIKGVEDDIEAVGTSAPATASIPSQVLRGAKAASAPRFEEVAAG